MNGPVETAKANRCRTVSVLVVVVIACAFVGACSSDPMTEREACEQMFQWWEDCGERISDPSEREEQIAKCEQSYKEMNVSEDTLKKWVDCFDNTPCTKDPKDECA